MNIIRSIASRHHPTRMTRPTAISRRLAEALGDVTFRLTTARLSRSVAGRAEIALLSERWRAAGGSLRIAGPAWFAVWGRDVQRMRRARAIVLPAPWIGLTDTETLAILADQLRRLDPGTPETPWLSNALVSARARLRAALSGA
ncbi:hypothetical protein RNZ50_15970 [Paracoccaceae bacterium Fryx2]|nr:hypothetical protein [Paracoccaceae bacterium Fryx2]